MPKRVDNSDLALGQTNKDIIADTTDHTGVQYSIIHALTDIVITSLTDATIANGTMAGVTLKAGDRYFGQVTQFRLTSGTAICYFG